MDRTNPRDEKYDVSASSLLELKALVSERRNKVLSTKESAVGSSRPKTIHDKRPSLAKRASPVEAADDWEKSFEALTKKSLLYSQLQRGEEQALSKVQREQLLIDFDRKNWRAAEQRYVPLVDEHEGLLASTLEPLAFLAGIYKVSLKTDLVEYLDEFGRTRLVTPEEVAVLKREKEETRMILEHSCRTRESDAVPTHYDAEWEIRTKGIGFFRFSADELSRQKQLMELQELRRSTEEERSRHFIQRARRLRFLEARRVAAAERRHKLNKSPE